MTDELKNNSTYMSGRDMFAVMVRNRREEDKILNELRKDIRRYETRLENGAQSLRQIAERLKELEHDEELNALCEAVMGDKFLSYRCLECKEDICKAVAKLELTMHMAKELDNDIRDMMSY